MSRCPPTAFLLDMDGVLYHGERILPGAREFLQRIVHWPHVYLTNNPIRTPDEVAEALAAIGLPRPPTERILTSALATARWLARSKPNFRYFAVGAGGLDAALRTVGQPDATNPDVVVVGEGAGLDYETLTLGINLILRRGARLVATNPDATVDGVRDGVHVTLPGGGALVAAFAVATGVTPTVIGKPEPLLFEMALEQLDRVPAQCLMVGDRPDTDIAGAERLGMWTALVRTGCFPPGHAWDLRMPRPDFDVSDLFSLMAELDRAFPGFARAQDGIEST